MRHRFSFTLPARKNGILRPPVCRSPYKGRRIRHIWFAHTFAAFGCRVVFCLYCTLSTFGWSRPVVQLQRFLLRSMRLLLALLDLYFLQPGARMNEANGPSIFHTLAARSFVLCPLWLTFQNLLSRFVAFSLWLLHFCRTINTTRGYGEQWVNMGMLGIFSYSAYDVTDTINI